ncbi:Calreticulin/calnexin [Trinorchestia longiramus]|nr:Calreticulin/calnexin [Trinorchestia longiramus]
MDLRDNDMDGEWEAPLINNPACAGASGCGPWVRPHIDNPNFRGKWKPKQIPNPNYRGEWVPRMIPNPDYFKDLEPFKMTPISAVGFELWSMSDNIFFDNIIITDNIAEAKQFAAETFDLKFAKLEKGKGGVIQRFLDYSNERPWLYAIYVLLAAVPVVLIIMCCCASPLDKGADAAQASQKKTDAPTADDPSRADDDEKSGEGDDGDEDEGEEDEDEQLDEQEEEEEEEQDEQELEQENEEERKEASSRRSSQGEKEDDDLDDAVQKSDEEKQPSPRQRRKVRRD